MGTPKIPGNKSKNEESLQTDYFKESSENLIKKSNINKASVKSNDDEFYDDFMVEDDEVEKKDEKSVKNAQKSSSGFSQSELYNKSKVATEVNDFDDLDDMEEL